MSVLKNVFLKSVLTQTLPGAYAGILKQVALPIGRPNFICYSANETKKMTNFRGAWGAPQAPQQKENKKINF